MLHFLDNRTLSASDCKSAHNRYLCKNQRCIFFNAVCNGKDDCGDGSDEGAGCKYDILVLIWYIFNYLIAF